MCKIFKMGEYVLLQDKHWRPAGKCEDCEYLGTVTRMEDKKLFGW